MFLQCYLNLSSICLNVHQFSLFIRQWIIYDKRNSMFISRTKKYSVDNANNAIRRINSLHNLSSFSRHIKDKMVQIASLNMTRSGSIFLVLYFNVFWWLSFFLFFKTAEIVECKEKYPYFTTLDNNAISRQRKCCICV